MRQINPHQIGIEIDSLTNSIQNAISGDSFETDVTALIKADLKTVTENKWLEVQLGG